jgi:hypothetical protein
VPYPVLLSLRLLQQSQALKQKFYTGGHLAVKQSQLQFFSKSSQQMVAPGQICR